MSTTAPSTALLDPLVERYLTQLRVEGGLATNTVEAYRRDLFRLQHHLLMHRLRMNDVVSSQVIRSFLAALKQESLAASSVARILSAMRGWYRFFVRERVLEGSPLREVAVARRPVRLPKTLTRSEVTALLELPVRDRLEDQRDRVMVELLYASGLRVSELVGLDTVSSGSQSRLPSGRGERYQGAMCAVCLGIIPVLTEYLGMPFEIAITIVILNGFLYLWHAHLGDPVVPGWITPAIPLLLLWLKTFPEGVPRLHALIAFEFGRGLFSLILGATGLTNRFVGIVPDALKAGILLGAGVAAVRLVFEKGGRFDTFPWTVTIAIGFAFYILFSNHFKTLRSKHVGFKYLSDLGLMPALILAIVIAPLFGELPWPDIKWGFTVPQFTALFTQWTPFSDRIGFPPFSLYLDAAPLVGATYIVLA